MISDGRKLFPARRWILFAAAAGVLAGLAAVYLTVSGAGNDPARFAGAGPQAAVGSAAADRACAAKAAKAKAVGAAAVGAVAAMVPAAPPVSLLPLAFEDAAGRPTTLASRAGRTVLLNLWASWCAPCRAEMPSLDRLQAEMGGARFEVVAVNVEAGSPEKPRRFLEEIGVKTLARYRDPSLGAFEDLQRRGLALGLPATFLVDAEGCLLALMNAPADWSGPDARRVVAAALAP